MTVEKRVKITVGGQDDVIDVRSFLKVVSETVAVLGAVSDDDVKWAIGTVSRASPLNFELVSESPKADVAVSTFLDGMDALDSDDGRPHGFSDYALKRAKSLVTPLDYGLSSIVFSTDDRDPVRVSQKVAATVDKVKHSPYYYSYTELEGSLDEINVHGSMSQFCIYDALTDDQIRCKFDVDETDEVAKLIRKRVRVYGRAKFRREADRPIEIRVDRYDRIGDPASMAEVHDAGLRLDSDENSEKTIRKLRGLDG